MTCCQQTINYTALNTKLKLGGTLRLSTMDVKAGIEIKTIKDEEDGPQEFDLHPPEDEISVFGQPSFPSEKIYEVTVIGSTPKPKTNYQSQQKKVTNINEIAMLYDTSPSHQPSRNSSLKCEVCFKIFSTPSLCKRHQLTHSKYAQFQCQVCWKRFLHNFDLRNHLLKIHNQKIEGKAYFPCEFCSKEFISVPKLEKHVVDQHVVDKEYECVVCSKKFIDQKSLTKHMSRYDTATAPKTNPCHLCPNKYYSTKQCLVRHLRKDHQLHYCNLCEEPFTHESQFNQHKESAPADSDDPQIIFSCEICSQIFNSQCNFTVHTKCHLKKIETQSVTETDHFSQSEKSLEPEEVEVNAADLNADTILEFQCELCLKVFIRADYVVAHRRHVHRHHVWKCNFGQCSRTFDRRSNLKYHEMTHTKTKPFIKYI